MLSFGQLGRYRLSNIKKNAGFSLLETTVAISILVSAITGPLWLASQGIGSASKARNNIIAANLAQEGLELIKNIRLNNLNDGKSWTNGLGLCGLANGCRIDAKNLNINNCSAHCAPLKFDDVLKLYNYESGQDSVFSRIITTQDINKDEIKIISSVKWQDKFGGHTFNLETSMFNW